MSATTKERDYIDGVFMKKFWNNSDNTSIMVGVGLKKREVIDQLEAMEEDEKGFVNLVMGTQKSDQSKFSLWKDNRDNAPAKTSPPPPSANKKSPPPTKTKNTPQPPVAEDDDDDLPF